MAAKPHGVPARAAIVVFLLVVLALLVGLLAVPRAASAGPPAFVKATKNPVPIKLHETTGTYDLTWDTGNGQPGLMKANVDNGPDIVFAEPPAGAAPMLGITLGQTIKWRLYDAPGRHLLASVTVTTHYPDQSCLQQCIKEVTVVPHGTYADFHIIAVHPENLRLQVVDGAKGDVVNDMTGPFGNDWSAPAKGLHPNTKYSYKVSATDEAGDVRFWSGTFTTLHRKVDATFDTIFIEDDSDDGSAGDLTFWFGVGDWDNNSYGEVSAETGETIHPSHSITLMDAPDLLQFRAEGRDADCNSCDFIPAPDPLDGFVWAGSLCDCDWEWSAAHTDAIVSFGGDPSEAYSSSANVVVEQYWPKFIAHVNYSVSYVP